MRQNKALRTQPIGAIPFAAGLVLLLSMNRELLPFGTAMNVAVPVLRSLAYSLVFLFFGYYFAAGTADETGKDRFSAFRRLSLFYTGAAVLYCLCLLASAYAAGSSELSGIFSELARFLTGGAPAALWFLPAALISAGIVCFVRPQNRRGILLAAAILYGFALLVTTYRQLLPAFLAPVRTVMTTAFSDGHCGFLSALLFTVAGYSLHGSPPKRAAGTYLALSVLFCAALTGETVLVLRTGSVNSAALFASSFPAALFLFCFLLKLSGGPSVQTTPIFVLGTSILLVGQFCCALYQEAALYPTLLFRLFSNGTGTVETALFVSFVVSAVRLAAFDRRRGWLPAFCLYAQRLIFSLFATAAFLLSFVGKRVKNLLAVLSFAGLTTLIWFYERAIALETCDRIFVVCCVVVLLCEVHPDLKPDRLSPGAFSAFFLAGTAMLISARLFNAENYAQIARLLLYFFIPLLVFAASGENAARPLLSRYTAGCYLSFAVFFVFCVLFRPFAAERYQGAFCNPNMCALYAVTVFAVAMCRISPDAPRKDLRKNLIHYLAAGASFAFALLTISRNALVGVLAILFVKLFQTFQAVRGGEKDLRRALRRFLPSAAVYPLCFLLCFFGVYLSVRKIPGLAVRWYDLFAKLSGGLLTPYMPKAGGAPSGADPVTLSRFLRAWFDRTLYNDSLNDLSSGRLTIYLAYLKRLSFSGSDLLRIPVEGFDTPMFAHNAFLQLAFNCGLLGGVLYTAHTFLCLLTGLFSRKRAEAAKAGVILLAGYAVCGMFESIEMFYYPILFCAFLGTAFCTMTVGSGRPVPAAMTAPAPAAAPEDALPRSDRAQLLSAIGRIAAVAVTALLFLLYLRAVLAAVAGDSRVLTQQLLQR